VGVDEVCVGSVDVIASVFECSTRSPCVIVFVSRQLVDMCCSDKKDLCST